MALAAERLAALGLNDFIAIDLETTGLFPQNDEIIEFGAVHFVDGVPVEGVSQLVKPSQPLLPLITRLTGIRPEDVALAPEPQVVIPALLQKWTRGTLVAHNFPFDFGFLKAAAQRYDQPAIDPAHGVDTLLLARTVLPTLFNHKLETLVAHFNIDLPNAHRARDDAQATGLLLLALLEAALKLDASILDSLQYLAPPGRLPNIFRGLASFLPRPSATSFEPAYEAPSPKQQGLEYAPASPAPLDLNAVLWVLQEGGPLSKSLEQFEARSEQLEMAKAVCEAFNRGTFLVAEAGTGVGKSFAYLAPALAWSLQNPGAQGRVVLSTRTKTLQDQLFNKDIPILRDVMGADWRVVLLKGRQNYLCLRRLDALVRGEQTAAEKSAMMPLISWLAKTQTGDLDEARGVWRSDVRRKVNDNPEYCVGRRCQFYNDCYSVNARQAARDAHLVVVNHALLMADLALDGAVLGDYAHLVLDEAHHLETSARQALQASIHNGMFKAMFDEALRPGEDGRYLGLLPALRRKTPPEQAETLEALDEAIHSLPALRGQVHTFFERLTEAIESLDKAENTLRYTLKRRYTQGSFGALSSSLEETLEQLSQWIACLDRIVGSCETALGDQDEEAVDALAALGRDLEGLAQTLTRLLQAQDEGFVFWYELAPKERARVTLFAAPLNVGEHLNGLYERLHTGVFTSATLSVGGDFSYPFKRLGLDHLPERHVCAVDFGQPYNHDQAVHFSVPTYFPPPNDPQFAQTLATLLFDVTTLLEKRTLALFTSYKLLEDVFQILVNKNIFVRTQRADEPRGRVLEEFQRGPKAALLLGTDSFWEGIDLPGESLEILVLTKVPFPVPTDPLVTAEEERLAEEGKSSFVHFSLPKAILTLRQGFGRLLRSKTDRGAVILTDTRVVHKGYGKQILGALPCQAHTYYTPSSLYAGLKGFFERQQ